MSAAFSALIPRAFWFLRHGETDWNARNLAQGAVDIALNETGLQQARIAAPKLRNRGITTILCSDLQRARVTAEIVSAELGLPIEIDPTLREVAFGVKEGELMAEWFSEWVAGTLTPDGAESFKALRARASEAINRALARPAPVLIVAHGGLFRAVRAEMGLEPNFRTPNATPLFCQPGRPTWSLIPA